MPFININKWFINSNNSFININKSFININRYFCPLWSSIHAYQIQLESCVLERALLFCREIYSYDSRVTKNSWVTCFESIVQLLCYLYNWPTHWNKCVRMWNNLYIHHECPCSYLFKHILSKILKLPIKEKLTNPNWMNDLQSNVY